MSDFQVFFAGYVGGFAFWVALQLVEPLGALIGRYFKRKFKKEKPID